MSLCFICELPILAHQGSGVFPSEEALEDGLSIRVPDSSLYHEDCLMCASCGSRLSGSRGLRRFHSKIYCSLHYADVAGLSSGDEFMQKLRDYKRQSLGCAEARRRSSTTLQFPVPVQACPGSPACGNFPHAVRVTPGYWIECSGSGMEHQSEEKKFELMSVEGETYEKHFYATEHWNCFTNDEALGPVILSIKQETEEDNKKDQLRMKCTKWITQTFSVSSRHSIDLPDVNQQSDNTTPKLQSVPESTNDGKGKRGHLGDLRVMLRTVSYCLHGLVPASCICADRYDREAVVKALGDEAGLKPPLVLGQLSSTPDELIKLDRVFIKTELKVGVILVREGQSTEEQILDNVTHTPLFDEFLSVLGERIRLRGWDKYKGGLDSVHDLTGTESVYTEWKGIEIMFHVSTLLPHEEHDLQKLQKKRHIGNDIVCVAFLESDDTLFTPNCIKSHFLHTFIAVRCSLTHNTSPTTYEVSVVSRDEVGAYKPYLWHQSKFVKGHLFRDWLLTKIVNGERASYSAPKFARMRDRTRSQMLEDIVTNLQNHVETGQMPKPYRRGSWRPIGHMRPSSPLLDGVRDQYENHDLLSRDFSRSFHNNRHICDVIFHVGQGKQKTTVYAVRAILGIRSRVFLEMLYGFTTGYGPCLLTSVENDRRSSIISTTKSSNFLQVPDVHKTPPASSPTVFRYFSRLGNWAGWGGRSKSPLSAAEGLKRWQSEFDCKEKEKERRESVAAEVSLSMCADAGKVDREKLSQTEFTVLEFDSDTFLTLVEYLQSGSCILTCENIPGLICAAEHYDLPELLQACFHHAKQHIRLSMVCRMLNVLENYHWRYNSASELVKAIMAFIETRPKQLFSRKEYLELSESMFQTIISKELGLTEIFKFDVMLQYSHNKVHKDEPETFQTVMNRLTRDLKLFKIPPEELIRVVLPSSAINPKRVLDALVYQVENDLHRVDIRLLNECKTTTSDFADWDDLERTIKMHQRP